MRGAKTSTFELTAIGIISCIIMWYTGTKEFAATPGIIIGAIMCIALGYVAINANLACSRRGDYQISCWVMLMRKTYLLKMLICILITTFVWEPGLIDKSSWSYGYDPQRFYEYAEILLENNFRGESLRVLNLNYTGIIYYFSIPMSVFGRSTLIPLFMNLVVTELAISKLIRFMVDQNITRGLSMLIIALTLAPEVLWFDCLSSRESLLMALTTYFALDLVSLIGSGNNEEVKPTIGIIMRIILTICGLVLVRLSMLVIIISSIAMLITLVPQRKGRLLIVIFVLISLVVAMSSLVPTLMLALGSSGVGLEGYLGMLTGLDQGLTDGWRELDGMGSFARELIPKGPFTAILYSIPRLLLYLLAPLGAQQMNFGLLAELRWEDWQRLFMMLSASINLMFFPLILAGIKSKISYGNQHVISYYLVLSIVLLGIAGGNFIIHERYRLAGSLLLLGGYYIGYNSESKDIRLAYIAWLYAMIVSIILFLVKR